jgi:hypothetical protein
MSRELHSEKEKSNSKKKSLKICTKQGVNLKIR